MIEVEVGDTIVEFPDGTDPKTIRRALSSRFGPRRKAGRQALPPPIPEIQTPDLVPRGFARDRADIEAGNLPTSLTDVPQELAKGARPAFVASGATLGGAAALPAGPLGLLLGTSAGAAAGSLAFDLTNSVLKTLGTEDLPGGAEVDPSIKQTAANQIQLALDEARTEAMFTGTFSTFFPVKRILAPAFGKLLGVRKDASKQMRRLAAAQGIELAAVDVGGPIAKGFARVLGIFPWVSGPLRKGQLTKEAQIGERFIEVLNEIAPTASLAGEASVDLLAAAQKSDKRFRAVSAGLYNTLRDDMRRLPAPTIPVQNLKEVTGRFAEESILGEIPLERLADDVPPQILKGGLNEDFEKFLKDVIRIEPTHLSYDQWASLQSRLGAFIDVTSPDPFVVKRVAQIKQAMEADLNNIGAGIPDNVVSAEILEELRLRKEGADAWFANGIVMFQSPTAQKFGRIDKNIFKAGAGKPGTLNVDELMKPVFNTESPQALRDLKALVGDDAFKRATRTHFEDTVSDSLRKEVRGGEDVEVFDLDAFQRNLGLVEGRKNKRPALEVMLEGTGIKVGDLDDLVTNARIMKINDPSVFVTRRAALGGAAGIMGALGVGGGLALGTTGAVGSPLIAAGVTLLVRHGAKILADPRKLKMLTASLRPEISEMNRRALLVRLARSLGEIPDEEAN